MTLNANKVEFAGKERTVLDAGNYPARIAQVIDLGLQTQRPYEGQEKAPQNEIMVTYELGTEFLEDEDGNPDPEKPRFVSERFSLFSLKSDKAKSTKRYVILDPTMECQGDWEQMVGKACLVAVVNNVSKANGRVYNNVGSISPPIKGMDVPALVNPEKTFDLGAPDMEVFNSLPEWIQGIIKENLNYQGSALQAQLEGAAPQEVNPQEAAPQINTDEVPF